MIPSIGNNKILAPEPPVTPPSVVYLKTNLISVWELDETSGTTAYDEFGSNDGTNTSATVNQTGKINQCYLFNGSSSNVSMGNVSALNFERTDSFSYSAWYKGTATDGAIFSKMDTSTGYRGFDLFVTSTGYAKVHIISTWSSNAVAIIGNTYTINDNSWHHIVGTYDGSSSASGIKIYVDGNLESSPTIDVDALSSTIQNSVSVRIGSRSNGSSAYNYTTGYIDQVAVWNSSLSEEQILELYNSGNGLPYSSWN